MNEWAGGFPGAIVTSDEAVEAEFESRLRESSTLAFRVAYGVLRHRQDAEEVAQEAFLKAHAHYHRLRDRDRFRAWLVRVAWRLAIDRYRADRRRTAREADVAPRVDASPEAQAEERQTSSMVRQALEALSPKLRIVLLLSAMEGHDVREVATLLRIPQGTVKSRLFAARKQLAERLRCLANDSPRR